MACYYLVISSTHLSNGHFRSIKGVFRGPLRKNGASLPGYAEKGKSIANALEDLKANFYCELCDKQYHKHQEFDNHINSYDHAHKQRLKELKQREYARNVASKSWKDEKKQEKALKRLHELAELRKQTDGVGDDGPLFKAPRFKGPQEDAATSQDEKMASSKCAITSNRDTIISNLEEPKQDISTDREVSKNSSCNTGSQSQQSPSNGGSVNSRAGVSFCFSRKALLKLDSSASVFNESTEEANECGQFPHYKEKQTSVSFRHYAHISETVAENSASSQQDETHISLADKASENAEKFKDDKGSQENTKEQSEIAQSNITVEMQSQDTTCTDQLSPKEVNVTSETELTSEVSDEVCCQAESMVKETCSSKHTVADAILIEHLSNILSQKNVEAEGSCNLNEASSTTPTAATHNSTESPERTLGESLNTPTKPLSFLSVLSKDGNTILQWPTELVLFTKTQPSISYACNPLYFDFKCSRKNNIGKSNEQLKGFKQGNPSKTDYDEESSGSNKEKVTDYQFSKGERDTLEKEMEPSENNARFGHVHEYSTQVCTDFLQNCSRKRKRLPHGQSENIKTPDYHSNTKNTKGEHKRKWFAHEDQFAVKDKWYSSDRSKRRKSVNRYKNTDGWENSDCSKDSESDTNSSMSTKSSFSQMSSSSSSIRNGLKCRTHEIALERVNSVGGKHNKDHSSKSDHDSEVSKVVKCGCNNEKHKTLSLEHHVSSRHANNGHRQQKPCDDLEPNPTVDYSHSVQEMSDISRYEGLEHHMCSKHTNNGNSLQKTHDDLDTNPTVDSSHTAHENNYISRYKGLEQNGCSRHAIIGPLPQKVHHNSEANLTLESSHSVKEINNISRYDGLEQHGYSRHAIIGPLPQKAHNDSETNHILKSSHSVKKINNISRYEDLEQHGCSRHAIIGPLPQKAHNDSETNLILESSHFVKKINNISRYEYMEQHRCSRHASKGHLPQKAHDDLETNPTVDSSHSVQEIRDTSCNTADSRVGHSSASPEETIHPSPSLKRPHDNNRKECFYDSPYPSIPLSMNSGNRTSEDIVPHTVARRKLLSQFFSEDEAYPTQLNENHFENNIELNKHQNHFDMSFVPADPRITALPLHDPLRIGINNGKVHVIEKTAPKNSQNTLNMNGYSCHSDVRDPINTECKSVPLIEAPGQLTSQLPSIMQTPDPIHLNFSFGMPSLRYQGGMDSPNTKEELNRMGHPNINMRLSPVDGNLKYCYESTMQDIRKMDNNRRLYHKSSPPPFTQQPVMFSPDEVDKYKSLQLQAQQHMQKQLLTKPFKALPANGSPMLSNTQSVQPVPIQHHPSFTTIHHAFMQRYAVTASMHSHISHFPLPHLNPLPQSQFAPISLSSLTPTLLPTPPQLIAGHPLPHSLHLVPAATIHPAHLTIQAIPHATLIPTFLTPHPNPGLPPTLQLHPFIHPLFQGQDIHHHSGPSHPH